MVQAQLQTCTHFLLVHTEMHAQGNQHLGGGRGKWPPFLHKITCFTIFDTCRRYHNMPFSIFSYCKSFESDTAANTLRLQSHFNATDTDVKLHRQSYYPSVSFLVRVDIHFIISCVCLSAFSFANFAPLGPYLLTSFL